MDNLIEKHRVVQIQNDGIWDIVHNSAKITKDIAIGFMEWYCDESNYFIMTEFGHRNIQTDEIVTHSELFDIYLKTL